MSESTSKRTVNEIEIEGRRTQDYPNCNTPKKLSLNRAGLLDTLAIPSLGGVSGCQYAEY